MSSLFSNGFKYKPIEPFLGETFACEEDWLEWRKGCIGSSDIASILGSSTFKTVDELFEEKLTGEQGEISSYVRDVVFDKAKTKEKEILNAVLDLPLFKDIDAENASIQTQVAIKVGRMSCTIDGLVNCNLDGHEAYIIIETKYISDMKNLTSIMYKQQLGWQGFVFREYLKGLGVDENMIILHVLGGMCSKDESIVKAELIYYDNAFFESLKNEANLFLKALDNKDLALFQSKPKKEVIRKDILPKTEDLELAYLNALVDVEKAEKALEEIKKKLLDGLDDKTDYVGRRVKICRQIVKGRVNYDDIPFLASTNLNRYRGTDTIRTLIKEK